MLGIGVGARAVHAVLVRGRSIRWAGSAEYASVSELADVLARLAGECGERPRRARVALERDLVQLRTLPAPPIRRRALPGFVALEAPRLFRNGEGPLVTDAVLVRLGKRERVLWAAATREELARAVLDGCAQAGVRVEGVCAAAELLSRVVQGAPDTGCVAIPNGRTTELLDVAGGRTWRSRLVRGVKDSDVAWDEPLAALGAEAGAYAAAHAAAVVRSRFALLPLEVRAAHARARARRSRLVAFVAAALWVLAGLTYAARLTARDRALDRRLAALAAPLDTALAFRRDLGEALAAIGTVAAAERERSSRLTLLAELTRALGDSTVLAAVRVSGDTVLHLAGYAPVAARALADVERAPGVRQARFESPSSRQTIPVTGGAPREWDRFAIVARLERAP